MVAGLDLAAGSCLLVMGGLFTDRKKTGSLKMHRVVPVFQPFSSHLCLMPIRINVLN